MVVWVYHLVGGIPAPLKNMSSSVGLIIIPNIWNHKIHVPNHQPVMYYHRPIVFEWGSRLLINQPVRKEDLFHRVYKETNKQRNKQTELSMTTDFRNI